MFRGIWTAFQLGWKCCGMQAIPKLLPKALELRNLSDISRRMRLYKEGIRRAKEASEILERSGDVVQLLCCVVTDNLTPRRKPDNAQSIFFREGQRILGLRSPSCSRRNISIQGQDQEGNSSFRKKPWTLPPLITRSTRCFG